MKVTSENPINSERVLRTETQLLLWMTGVPLHNGQTSYLGECCPDFSCCFPELLLEPTKRVSPALKLLKSKLTEELRRCEEDGIDLQTQNIMCKQIEKWFEDLIYDSRIDL